MPKGMRATARRRLRTVRLKSTFSSIWQRWITKPKRVKRLSVSKDLWSTVAARPHGQQGRAQRAAVEFLPNIKPCFVSERISLAHTLRLVKRILASCSTDWLFLYFWLIEIGSLCAQWWWCASSFTSALVCTSVFHSGVSCEKSGLFFVRFNSVWFFLSIHYNNGLGS